MNLVLVLIFIELINLVLVLIFIELIYLKLTENIFHLFNDLKLLRSRHGL